MEKDTQTRKQSRWQRHKLIPMKIQERDLGILKDVYEYRFLSSYHIDLLHGFEGKRSLQRRLQKLWSAGYLDRPRDQIKLFIDGYPNYFIYALGNKGADLISSQLGIDRWKIDWTAKNLELKDRYLLHTLQIASFRAAITLSLRNSQETKILFWLQPGELKQDITFQEEGKTQRVPIIPDGFFAIEDKEDEMFFFLEADQSTMSNQRFFNKMRAYFQLWKYLDQKVQKLGYSPFQVQGFQIKSFRVLTITKTEERKENLREVTKRADDWQSGFEGFWFACEENYSLDDPRTILNPIWQTPKDDKFHYILE